MSALAREHELTGLSLISPDLDVGDAEAAMLAYCQEVRLIGAPPWHGLGKRVGQLRSVASRRSFESRALQVPGLARALAQLLASRRFDLICFESPFLCEIDRSLAPLGVDRPTVVLDEHNIEFDLARQQAAARNPLRRLYNASNWRKVRREELGALRRCDGVTFCSQADESRARTLVPSLRSAMVPNAVDLDYFKADPAHPASDGHTVMFFGAINYFPNIDGLRMLLRDVWPQVAASHPRARLRIVGQHPTAEILACRSARVEVTGRVDDLRPLLAAAAVTVVPLRLGGGTRLKILEAMAMARPVVSTPRGAEGIDAQPGRDLLLGADAAELVAQLRRVLDNPALGAQLGNNGRKLVEERYSWRAAAATFVSFVRALRPRATRR